MNKTRIVFVGGFLGAGKTTLLWRAAEMLMKRGKRVGLITNDQAPDLVDTKWLAQEGLNVREVAGSCFGCNFAGPVEWSTFCSDLLARLQAAFCQRDARIGHVKLLLAAAGGHYVGNFTDCTSAASLQGRIVGTPPQADLTLNARVEMSPEELEPIVRDVLGQAADRHVRAELRGLRCLCPGRPQPTHRYDKVVD